MVGPATKIGNVGRLEHLDIHVMRISRKTRASNTKHLSTSPAINLLVGLGYVCTQSAYATCRQ